MAGTNAGGIYAELGVKSEGLKKGLREAQGHLKSFTNKSQQLGRGMMVAGGAMMKLSAGIAAVGAGMVASTIQIGNAADKLLDLEQQTGLSTDQLQEFGAVARAAGVGPDTLSRAAIGLQRQLREGGEESKSFRDAMAALGVSARDAEGNLRPTSELMPEMVARLSDMEDSTARNSLAMQVFGRAGTDLIPVLGMGSAAIDDLTQSARESGEVMSTEQLNAANESRIAFENLKAEFGLAAREIQIAVVPMMTKLAEIAREHVVPAIRDVAGRISSIINWFNDLDPAVQKGIGVFTGFAGVSGTVVFGLGTILTIAPKVAAAFATMSKAAKLAWASIGGPVTLTIAGITAAGVAIYVFRDDIKKALYKAAEYANKAGAAILRALEKVAEQVFKTTAAAASLPGALGAAARGALPGVAALQTGLGNLADKADQAADEWRGLFDAANREVPEPPTVTPIASGDTDTTTTDTETDTTTPSPTGPSGPIRVPTELDLEGIDESYLDIPKPEPVVIETEMAPIQTYSEEELEGLRAYQAQMEMLASASQQVGAAVTGAMNEMIGGLAEGIGMMMAGEASAADLARGVITTLADLAIRVGKIAIAVGVGVEGIKKALSALNPALAIGAGIALIALGSWAKSALGGAAGGGGSAGATGGVGAGTFNTPDVGYSARRAEQGGAYANQSSMAITVGIQGESSLRGTTLHTQYRKTEHRLDRRGMG